MRDRARPAAFGPLARNQIKAGLDDALDSFFLRRNCEREALALRFPPVIDMALLVRNNYFVGFPHLAGCIHSFSGSAEDHKSLLYNLMCDEPVEPLLTATGLALTPAACYPVYPAVAANGPLPAEGLVVTVHSWCFRHEPSADPARQRAFRMREFIYLGSAGGALTFRDGWMERAGRISRDLGLEGRLERANDPFFGAEGTALQENQRERGLKFEMLLRTSAAETPSACMSFNYHESHFGATWDIRQADGEIAHTACVGFGIERCALAVLAAHGEDRAAWPQAVKDHLWPT